jgi:hypothetical protein
METLRAVAGPEVPSFGRGFFSSDAVVSRIGGGELGGKAGGLVRIERALAERFPEGASSSVRVSIPRMTVLATDVFDSFMDRGGLYDVALSGLPDERIARAFQKADLPPEILGDLRALIDEAHTPLAVRSSSLLEDALAHPFAGIYETKMVPNLEPDPSVRFRELVEAVKLVYSSTFFSGARTYRRVVGVDDRAEKMAVIVQEVVGARHGARFYPDLSAVCRSFNYYPTGPARPSDGVVQLALGLGKTIVDGGVCWSYSPRFPAVPPPFASTRSMLKETQTRYWAVNMDKPPAYDPISEAEYLSDSDLADADYDGTLLHLASTYDAASDRLLPGTGRSGPRVIDFAPLLRLREWPVNEVLSELLTVAESSLEQAVEIEVAATLPAAHDGTAFVGLVQVRAMVTPGEDVEVAEETLTAPDLLMASRRVMGNGEVDTVRDIVYVNPDTYEPRYARAAAEEVGALNSALMEEGRPYLLLGFGRWGSSDPWLGIPVTWGQVAGARVIVEATLPDIRIDPSQGAHFFHNVASLGVVYFALTASEPTDVRWSWLASQPAVRETEYLRHVRLATPLLVRVDGRSGRGFVRWCGPVPGGETP